mmetsp:Transcript_21064/g.51838  ORF Transcript_21064/g.51838 Transcript_21064/m.51838 type:complete len:1143 (-) Transcript_21064:54-3482(-)
MPTLRRHRKSKKQKKQKEEEKKLENKATPHPYHRKTYPIIHDVPTPEAMMHNFENMGHLNHSEPPRVADISMDTHLYHHQALTAKVAPASAASALDEKSAILEYSDTSDDLRGEDRYFSLPYSDSSTSLLGSPSRASRNGLGGSSAFQTLRNASREESHNVVRYSSNPSDTPFDEKSDGSPEDPPTLPLSSSNEVPSDDSARSPSWVTNLAYSFRGTRHSENLETPELMDENNRKHRKHRKQRSSNTMEFPPSFPFSEQDQQRLNGNEATPLLKDVRTMKNNGVYGSERSDIPLLPPSDTLNGKDDRKDAKAKRIKSRKMAAVIASCYLMDYENGRPPSLSSNFETITHEQLRLYRIQFSETWRWLGVNLAVILLFMAHAVNDISSVAMHSYAVTILLMEVWMKEVLYGQDHSRDFGHRDRALVRPMMVLLFALGIESWTRLVLPEAGTTTETHTPQTPFILVTAVFKPLVLFYTSRKARNALEALQRIGKIVIRVLLIEVFLILSFAAVACRMYKTSSGFESLAVSWLSLFELSTTVVNPSIWMPMYKESQSSAFFFIFFIVTASFYIHSLVLSVVFQTYMQASADIHERSAWYREEATRLAFLALAKNGETETISVASVRKTLQLVRPHYSNMKIKALMDIVNPDGAQIIDYTTFRTKIRQALNASIRTSSSATTFAMGVELIAVFVAISNFVYVILMTSEFDTPWFDSVAVLCGSAITLLGLLELVIRFNPLRIPNFAPLTRLNITFDGLALVGALVSMVGIIYYVVDDTESATDYILMGRAIDMIRVMRFFQIFRDIVRRSADVFPALRGPVFLVVTVLHTFVYIGMILWGGAIDVEILAKNAQITPLYYLNNFNSYAKGLVTMFNVFIVNDWHAIAEVFLYADRCSSPLIVYPFFVFGLCIGVFIMLNVVTAFFVEAFMTKLGDKDPKSTSKSHQSKTTDFHIHTPDNTGVKKISSIRSLKAINELKHETALFGSSDDNSVASHRSTEIFSFDVYERGGFDQVMSEVNKGISEQGDAFARAVCDYLEIFEGLVAGREKVGYMVCCQQSMNRFGNRRFQNNAMEYIKEETLQRVVGDMHSELLVLSTSSKFNGRCLVRRFAHKSHPSTELEIAASLLRYQPAVTLLVSRIRPSNSDKP